jgi:HEAT repeat protein
LLSLADFQAKEARDRVLSLLGDPEIEVRQMAILCLGEIAESADVEVLGRLSGLLRAGHASLRYQALLAHSQLAPAQAAPDLLLGVSDVDPEVRELALRLVDEVLIAGEHEVSAELRDKVLAACKDEAPHVRLMAQIVCADLGWEAPTETLLDLVSGRMKAREPRDEQLAISLAGRCQITASVPALRRRAFGRFFFSFDPFRWVALGALCQMGDERARERLVGSLGSRNFLERTMAVKTLGDCGERGATALLSSLVGSPERVDQEVLKEALEMLRAAPALDE